MKRTFNIIVFMIAAGLMMLATASSANAQQQPLNRANSTIVIDAMNQLPADNEEQFNLLMEDIASTGREGLDILINVLEKKDDAMVCAEYALDGLSMYASANSFDAAKRKVIIDTFTEAMKRAKKNEANGDLVGFYGRQLKRLGVVVAAPHPLPVKETPEDAASLKKEVSEAVKVMKKGSREERFAVLYSIDTPSDFIPAFVKALPKMSPEAQSDVIWWIGEQKDISYEDAIFPYLQADNEDVFAAAEWALVKMRSEKALPVIAEGLLSDTTSDVELSEACLRSAYGPVADVAASIYSMASVPGKSAILRLFAQRRSAIHKDIVFSALESGDAPVRDAAYDALKDVVVSDDLESLYAILEMTDPKDSPKVCDAIQAALSDKTKAEQYRIFRGKVAATEGKERDCYIPLVIRTAGVYQLFSICTMIDKGEINCKFYDMAFDAYVKAVGNSEYTDAKKLLLFKKIMPLVHNDAQKCSILESVGHTGEFLGIIFAGTMIDDPATQQAAARAIMSIALSHDEYCGSEVTALLNRVAEVLEGPDADYEKTAVLKHIAELPQQGFESMFDGKTLNGWKGIVENPYARLAMSEKKMAKAQREADARMAENWKVEDGCIVYEGNGFDNLCTVKQYGDFEMYVDWKLDPAGTEPDAGIYLRGTPQVQIWDTSRVDVGAQVGSGGLYNNQKNPSVPLCVADNALGSWNSFYIKMVGERVTVLLNGIKVVDNVIMENYWYDSLPIPMREQIELQAHGSRVFFKNLYIKELPQAEPYVLSDEEKADGFDLLFDGTSLHRFKGNLVDYSTDNGTIHVFPTGSGYGNLYVDDEFSDFIFRFDFKLTPGANNGVGIRCEEGKDAAYYGMEIQILDHFNPIYQPALRDYQYHGSVYGIIPAQVRDAHNPVGEWNSEEIYVKGNHIKVTLNGKVITEGDIDKAAANGTYDGNEHPGLFNKSGLIGFLGHGSELWLRNIRVKKL